MTESSLRKAFADATDRWKIDGRGGLKGYYLHSGTGRLFSWDQPNGVLYEFDCSSGKCDPIWAAANAAENAEIWTLLPLPPTDPAAAAQVEEEQPSIQIAIPEGAVAGQVLQVTAPGGTEVQFVVPPDAIPGQVMQLSYTPPEDFLLLHILEMQKIDVVAVVRDVTCFASKYGLSAQNIIELKNLSYEGQSYVEKNYANQKLPVAEYIEKCMEDRPWEQEYCVLRVDARGAILGSCLPELASISGLAQAHCQIVAQKDRSGRIQWYARDLESKTGSFMDTKVIPTDEPGASLRTNSVLDLGNLVEMIVEIHEVDARGASTNAGIDINAFRRSVAFQETVQEIQERKRQREEYNDRAELRRVRVDNKRLKGAGVDRLLDIQLENRSREISKEEKKLNEEEAKTARKHQEEAGMDTDGSFLGAGSEGGSRGGIGFRSEAEDFAAPRGYSAKDAAKFKTQKRFEKSR